MMDWYFKKENRRSFILLNVDVFLMQDELSPEQAFI